ncbi:hypothetical protein Ancab_037112 [Ancistrocladus abbreviatus]
MALPSLLKSVNLVNMLPLKNYLVAARSLLSDPINLKLSLPPSVKPHILRSVRMRSQVHDVSENLRSSLSTLCLLQDERQLRDALVFSNACGALTVTEKGAIPALPTKEAVLQILSTATH